VLEIRRLLPVRPGQPPDQGPARQRLIDAARAGQDLDEDRARHARVVEYEVPDRDGDGKGELIALVTTITDFREAPAAAYHRRWEHEIGHRWHRSSRGAFSRLFSCVVGFVLGRRPAGAGVLAGRACPALA
jgi:hypothetical protein